MQYLFTVIIHRVTYHNVTKMLALAFSFICSFRKKTDMIPVRVYMDLHAVIL